MTDIDVQMVSPVETDNMSSAFGWRYSNTAKVYRQHAGVDFPHIEGTSVKAALDGEVTEAGYNVAYGNYVVIESERGIVTIYKHLYQPALVQN